MSGENQTEINSLMTQTLDVGGLLRAMRTTACLTQRQLASLIHVSAYWVRVRERNQVRVGLVEFIRWSKACDQDPGEAVGHLLGPSIPFREPAGKVDVTSLNHTRTSQFRINKTALR